LNELGLKTTPHQSGSGALYLMALQDGGELIDRQLSVLPDEVWQEFQKSFLN
jgi:hypothetical protein